MADVAHYFSADIQQSATGDLLAVDGLAESQQRVLRRLLTNPGDYIWQLDYGAGLPRFIGQPIDQAALTSLIKTQMYLEPSVARSPEPVVQLTPIANGVSARIQYVEVESGQPTVLSFTVSPESVA
jgi:phage baseplate assembly protein W